MRVEVEALRVELPLAPLLEPAKHRIDVARLSTG